jgi:hypothetical protein
MTDTFQITLDEDSEKKLFEIMTEVNTEKTNSFVITDKYGHTNVYVKVIRCKDCKYWETDDDESFCSDWGAYGTGSKSYCSFAKRKEECQ